MQPATVARRLSAIRQLYRFLYAEGQRNDDPAAVLEGPRRARALPKTLTLAEVDRLLAAAGACDAQAPLAVRLRATDVEQDWTLGPGDPVAEVAGPAERLLLLLWKRVPAEDASLAWSGDRSAGLTVLAGAVTP